MRLYYTNSTGTDIEQSKSSLSLGGYKSSSKVPNGVFNNMFADITPATVSNFNQNRYIALILVNETGKALENVNFWFDLPEVCSGTFKIAAVDLVLQTDGSYLMERVDSVYEKPVNGEFFESSGEINAVDLGNLAIGEQIGLWVEMALKVEDIKDNMETVYEVDPTNEYRFQEIEKDKFEEISINISYDEVVVP